MIIVIEQPTYPIQVYIHMTYIDKGLGSNKIKSAHNETVTKYGYFISTVV